MFSLHPITRECGLMQRDTVALTTLRLDPHLDIRVVSFVSSAPGVCTTEEILQTHIDVGTLRPRTAMQGSYLIVLYEINFQETLAIINYRTGCGRVIKTTDGWKVCKVS